MTHNKQSSQTSQTSHTPSQQPQRAIDEARLASEIEQHQRAHTRAPQNARAAKMTRILSYDLKCDCCAVYVPRDAVSFFSTRKTRELAAAQGWRSLTPSLSSLNSGDYTATQLAIIATCRNLWNEVGHDPIDTPSRKAQVERAIIDRENELGNPKLSKPYARIIDLCPSCLAFWT